jgi:lysophospholipase L1-like esterase
MKTILCFGDSNTWGYDPVATASSPFPRRHPHDVRWTGVLARELGAGYSIIEEGQNGRTTVHDDPIVPHRNGRVVLHSCLESHKPLDLVVLMLGTNDLKSMFNLPPAEIATGAGALVKIIQQSDAGPEGGSPKILLVCPPAVGDLTQLLELSEKFAGAHEKSKRFPAYYEAVALQHGCAFLDIQPIVAASQIDGLHLEASQHAKLGKAMADAVLRVFAD